MSGGGLSCHPYESMGRDGGRGEDEVGKVEV